MCGGILWTIWHDNSAGNEFELNFFCSCWCRATIQIDIWWKWAAARASWACNSSHLDNENCYCLEFPGWEGVKNVKVAVNDSKYEYSNMYWIIHAWISFENWWKKKFKFAGAYDSPGFTENAFPPALPPTVNFQQKKTHNNSVNCNIQMAHSRLGAFQYVPFTIYRLAQQLRFIHNSHLSLLIAYCSVPDLHFPHMAETAEQKIEFNKIAVFRLIYVMPR